MNILPINSTTSFKKTEHSESGMPYHKTHAGLAVAAAVTVPAVYINLHPSFSTTEKNVESMKKLYNSFGLKKENSKKLIDAYKNVALRMKKLSIPFAAISGTCTLATGIIYDKIRNNRAKEAANSLATGNFKNMPRGGNMVISDNGLPYYKSNNAVSYGSLAGVVCGLIDGVMICIKNKKFSASNMILPTAFFTLGGIITGAIAQNFANKNAEKNAQKII